MKYEPFGWHHWPDHFFLSYQFRRALGEAQVGAGAVSECFRAASFIRPHDNESWCAAWLEVADRNRDYAQAAFDARNPRTSKAAWLRACNYYRSAEFMLEGSDPRRLQIFGACEQMFRNAGALFDPPIEVVSIPFENGNALSGYFLTPPGAADGPLPTVISFGGVDSIKEECYFMIGMGLAERGIATLLMDGPGQGGARRRLGLTARADWEVPMRYVCDYLETRSDVDMDRVGIVGTSLGGYYSARAACFEPRISACVSHGAEWDVHAECLQASGEGGDAMHMRWILGVDTWDEVLEATKPFTLEGAISHMRCPYLIVHGAYDYFGNDQATLAYEGAKAAGVDVTLRVVATEETGADHCQHDNPSLGLEIVGDWFKEVL